VLPRKRAAAGRAALEIVNQQSGVDFRWVAGSLGLHEEYAQTIADPILRFLEASPSARFGF
jgi:hypothetical protein